MLASGDARTCRGFLTDLVVRCGRGDDAALALLFDLFHPLVGSLAVAHAPQREVTDVVLDAFTRVWQSARAFRPEAQDAVSWVLSQLASAVAEHAAGPGRRPGPCVGDEVGGVALRRGGATGAAQQWPGPV